MKATRIVALMLVLVLALTWVPWQAAAEAAVAAAQPLSLAELQAKYPHVDAL